MLSTKISAINLANFSSSSVSGRDNMVAGSVTIGIHSIHSPGQWLSERESLPSECAVSIQSLTIKLGVFDLESVNDDLPVQHFTNLDLVSYKSLMIWLNPEFTKLFH